MEKNTVPPPEFIYESNGRLSIGYHEWNEWVSKYLPESPAPLSAEEMVDKVREILDDELDVTTDNWGHYVGTKGKDEAASRIAALLSQRQPVAPEREEVESQSWPVPWYKNREEAVAWWGELPADERAAINKDYPVTMTVMEIYRAERDKHASPSAENKGGSADGLSKKGGEG